MSILKLPHWTIIDKFPSFFEHESATTIEMTGKLYAKVNELIEAHNKWVNDVNQAIETYENENNKDYSCFTQTIIKLTSDYIGMVDLKIIQHDRKFEEHYKSFTSEIIKTTQSIINELKENGELDAALLEAVANLETKFGTFKNEVQAIIEDITASHNVFKAELKAEQHEFIEDAKAIINTTKTDLQADYSETKTDLQADYSETKTALETDYSETKTDLEADYLNVKNGFFNQLLAGEIMDCYKDNKYKHNICIYGVLDHATQGKVRINFFLTNTSSYPEPYTTVESAIKSLPVAKRHPVNGFFRYDNDQTLSQLGAVCYMNSDIDNDGEPDYRFWFFDLNSINGLSAYLENGEPMNLFNHLANLNIIDDVVPIGKTDKNGNVETVNELAEYYNANKYKHNICIYGVLNHAEQGKVRIAVELTNTSSHPEPYTTVESAIKSLPVAKRHPVNGFFRYNNDQTLSQLGAVCYMNSDIDNDGEPDCRFWFFALDSVLGLPVYTENEEPMNLFNHLANLNIIDDVVPINVNNENGGAENE